MNIDLPTGYTSTTIAELARLKAIAEAAELMAKRMEAFRHFYNKPDFWLATGYAIGSIPRSMIFDDKDRAALAAYEKAIKS